MKKIMFIITLLLTICLVSGCSTSTTTKNVNNPELKRFVELYNEAKDSVDEINKNDSIIEKYEDSNSLSSKEREKVSESKVMRIKHAFIYNDIVNEYNDDDKKPSKDIFEKEGLPYELPDLSECYDFFK